MSNNFFPLAKAIVVTGVLSLSLAACVSAPVGPGSSSQAVSSSTAPVSSTPASSSALPPSSVPASSSSVVSSSSEASPSSLAISSSSASGLDCSTIDVSVGSSAFVGRVFAQTSCSDCHRAYDPYLGMFPGTPNYATPGEFQFPPIDPDNLLITTSTELGAYIAATMARGWPIGCAAGDSACFEHANELANYINSLSNDPNWCEGLVGSSSSSSEVPVSSSSEVASSSSVSSEDNTVSQLVAGQLSWGLMCSGCHGRTGLGSARGPVIDSSVSLQALTDKIDADMPMGNASACVGECAANIAALIKNDYALGVDYDVAPYNVIGTSECDGTFTTCSTFENGYGDVGAAGQLDNTVGYNSNASVRIQTGQGFMRLNVPSSDFWARVFIRGNPGQVYPAHAFSRGHGTYLKTEGSEEMRIGDHRCQLEINRRSDDFEMSSGFYGSAQQEPCQQTYGARMKPNTWYCLEAHFNGPDREVQVFWDNQNVEQLHVTANRIVTNEDKKTENGYNGAFGNPNVTWGPNTYTSLLIGHEIYFESGNTYWFDNVATSSERIGCGVDYEVKGLLDPSTLYPGYSDEENL